MPMQEATSSSNWVRLLYQTLQLMTDDAEQLFQNAGISVETLHSTNQRISVIKIAQIWKQAVSLTQDDAIALTVAKQYIDKSGHVLMLAGMSSETAIEAIQRTLRFYHTLSNGISLTYEINQGIQLTAEYAVNAHHECWQPMDATMAILAKVGNKLLINHTVHPESITLQRPKPKNAQAFQDYFDCPIVFNAGKNTICFQGDRLFEPLPSQNPSLAEHLDIFLHQELKAVNEMEFTSQVYQAMKKQHDFNSYNLHVIAKECAVSERTLQRKLKQEGSCFNQMAIKLKIQRAKTLLNQAALSQGEISDQLGFSTQSNFIRFFKSQTGLTPKEYTKALIV